MKLREAKYTKDSMILRKKIIDYAKVLGYKLHSTEKQARSFAMWFNGNNKEKLEKFLLKNGFKRGGEYANFDFSKGDIGFSFQGPGNFYMAHWYSTPTKLDRGIDATVSDKDYFGEIRREIRKVLGEQRSSWKEQQIERDKIWGCIEYFASGNYNELADYEFSNEQLMKQARDYIKGSDKYQEFLKCCEETLKEQVELRTATTVRNALIKALQSKKMIARPLSRWSESNPYSKRQTLKLTVEKVRDNNEVIEAIKSLGFNVKNTRKYKEDTIIELSNDLGISIGAWHTPAHIEKKDIYDKGKVVGSKDKKVDSFTEISITGPKKYKVSNLPYYD